MPSGAAQESLIRSVYSCAGLDPSGTGYIECHGTGTAIGDPMEAAALGAVFGKRGVEHSQPTTYVGSLKTNVGHLGGASRIVSLIKTALMLERGFILPNCDFEKLNPDIPLSEWNMKVNIDFPSSHFKFKWRGIFVLVDAFLRYQKLLNPLLAEVTLKKEEMNWEMD